MKFLVFDDADLDATIDGAKMRNGGQACTAANRFYVQRGIAPEFSRRLADAMTGMRVGPGADPGVQLGPLVNAEAVDKVDSLVAGAVSAGARAVAGWTRPAGPGFYDTPTMLADVPPSAEMLTEEIFGPFAPIATFDSRRRPTRPSAAWCPMCTRRTSRAGCGSSRPWSRAWWGSTAAWCPSRLRRSGV